MPERLIELAEIVILSCEKPVCVEVRRIGRECVT
jgi:hypothetical protein